jgi:hypothetical protein
LFGLELSSSHELPLPVYDHLRGINSVPLKLSSVFLLTCGPFRRRIRIDPTLLIPVINVLFLFACDEIAGFITACCYVRPSKSILDLEMESVRKKLKDKAFAKSVSCDDVRNGAAELGIPIEEHIAFCIAAMRENADALGLRGSL